MRQMPPLVAAAAAVTLTFAGLHHAPVTAIATTNCWVEADDSPIDGEEQAAVDEINAIRAHSGLAPLAVSPALTRAARWKSADLAGGTPFGHDDSFRGWAQRLRDCGYPTTWARENIAAGYASGGDTVRQWMDSGPHRANILAGDMRAVGIARRAGGVYGWYWTADFGSVVD
jgi:uncharacterized protein YkwD